MHEDGSEILEVCTSTSDFVYLLVRYVFMVLSGFPVETATEWLGLILAECL